MGCSSCGGGRHVVSSPAGMYRAPKEPRKPVRYVHRCAAPGGIHAEFATAEEAAEWRREHGGNCVIGPATK